METLARKLRDAVNRICIEYYYFKAEDTVDKSIALRDDIEQLAGGVLAVIGDDGEAQALRAYVIQVLNDYVEAAKQRDEVLMLDTLDYGLRNIFMLYIDEEEGAESYEQ